MGGGGYLMDLVFYHYQGDSGAGLIKWAGIKQKNGKKGSRAYLVGKEMINTM